MVPEVESVDEVEDIQPPKEEDTFKEEIEIDVKELEEEFTFEEEVIEFPEEIIIVKK